MSSSSLLPFHASKPQEPLPSRNTAQTTNHYVHGDQLAVEVTPKSTGDKRKEANYKTVMCMSWLKTNMCSYADRCRFAHGDHELRPPPQPTPARRKTQLCTKYTIGGICPFGNLCRYTHPPPASVNIQQSMAVPLFPMSYPPPAYGVPGMYGAFAGPHHYPPAFPPNPNFGVPVAKKCECDMSDSLVQIRAPKPIRAPLLPLRNHHGGCSTVDSHAVMSYPEKRSRIVPSAPPLHTALESVIWSPEKRNYSAESTAFGTGQDQTPLQSFDHPSACNVDSHYDVERLAKWVSELDVTSKPLCDELDLVEPTSPKKNWSETATPVARPKKDRVSRGPFNIVPSAYWKD